MSSNPSNTRTDIAYASRTRSRRPCDSCRRRKSRCELVDGQLPCVLCRFHRQECTFVAEPQLRKRRAAPRSRDKDLSPFERMHYTSSSLDATASSLMPSKQAEPSHDERIRDHSELGSSLLNKTLGLHNNRHSRLIGATSVYEQTMLEPDNLFGRGDVRMGSSLLRIVGRSDHAFLLSPDEETRNHKDEIPDLDAIESIVSPHGEALIHLYFRIVHPSFPILHKHVFLEKYQRSHREFSPPLLAAVYILALNWWSYSSELALVPKPDVSALEKLAFKTMSDIVTRPKLSTIQAGLLLLQRPEGDSWALTTSLVGLGQDLGLHLDCTAWSIPSWERGLRKRLAWGLFMQDKWGALMHARPSHITLDDWEVRSLQDDDFPENAAHDDHEDGSTEVEKGRATFCEMVRLTEILSLILSSFYSRRSAAEIEARAAEGVRPVLETAKPIQLALRQWYADLPPSLKMDIVGMRKLSSTGYLHLGYYAVEMTLHRRIVRSLSVVDDVGLKAICRQAARDRLVTAMDFVQGLRPEHLQSFWFFASSYSFALIGSFVSLLWATSTEHEEAIKYRTKLEEYRWMLRLSSRSARIIEQSISILATSTDILVGGISEQQDPNHVWGSPLSRVKSVLANTGAATERPRTPSQEQFELELYNNVSPNVIKDTHFNREILNNAADEVL